MKTIRHGFVLKIGEEIMKDKRDSAIKWMMIITLIGILMMFMTLFCSWNWFDDESQFCKALIGLDERPRDFYGRLLPESK